jgi:hypothetical protein
MCILLVIFTTHYRLALSKLQAGIECTRKLAWKGKHVAFTQMAACGGVLQETPKVSL